MIYWFTGLPDNGKTTVSHAWAKEVKATHLHADTIRMLFPEKFDEDSRRRNVLRVQAVARYLHDVQGDEVVVDCIAPFREMREQLKDDGGVLEIYVYGRADVPLWHVEYEPPLKEFLGINTAEVGVEDAVRLIHRAVADMALWPRMAYRAKTGRGYTGFDSGTGRAFGTRQPALG